MIYNTIDTFTRELEQLNQSARELDLIDDVSYVGNIERLYLISKYYYGKKHIQELEKFYREIKVYETLLIGRDASNATTGNGKEKK